MKNFVLKIVQENGILAVAPHYNGVHSSIVYTHQGDLSLVETVDEIMDQICLSFGSDLKGRISGSRKKFRYIKKPPILISERLGLVALPLPTAIRGDYLWVFTQSFDIIEMGPSKCKIQFDDKLTLDIPLSKESIDKQRVRAIQILYAFAIMRHFTTSVSPFKELEILNGARKSEQIIKHESRNNDDP